ncbi:hypothetical protein TWF281_003736 [Arthrobotrys megalospora]
MPLEFDLTRAAKAGVRWGDRTPLAVSLQENTILIDGRLEITFRRTVKVPDNDQTSHLPPDLGEMELVNVNKFASTLPDAMAAKGGLLMSMHDNEATWIKFGIKDRPDPMPFPSQRRYAIKVLIGGVNAISGEPEVENTATSLRRSNLLASGGSVQDYLVVPDQPWIDGIAIGCGKVRQFVAKPLGQGYTVEGQVTGREDVGGLQFEVIRTKGPEPKIIDPGCIRVKQATSDTLYMFNIGWEWPVHILKTVIGDEFGYPAIDQRLTMGGYNGQLLGDFQTLRDCGLNNMDILTWRPWLRGGGSSPPYPWEQELGIAAGGKIHQVIVKDYIEPKFWDKEDVLSFNVQILNAKDYARVTGPSKPGPPLPVDPSTYAGMSGCFYEYPESETNVHGDFGGVKSVAQITGKPDKRVGLVARLLEKRRKKEPANSTIVSLQQSDSPSYSGPGASSSRPYSSEPARPIVSGSRPTSSFENAEKKPRMLEEYLAANPVASQNTSILCQCRTGKVFRTKDEVEASARRRKYASFD